MHCESRFLVLDSCVNDVMKCVFRSKRYVKWLLLAENGVRSRVIIRVRNPEDGVQKQFLKDFYENN